MLRDEPILDTLLVNLLLGTIWHFATFFLCISINVKHFDSKKRWYRPKKWEKDGKWYADHLKINKWKDFLPQHVSKDGFSKEHLDDVSIEYLDEFIMETCRGEWNHGMNCLFAVVIFLINSFTVAICLAPLVIIGNLPFALVQRYNRFRLERVRSTIIKKQKRAKKRAERAKNKPDTESAPEEAT